MGLSKVKGIVAVLGLMMIASCTKQAATPSNQPGPVGDVETYPIGNFKMKNCHFNNPNPTYAFGATIAPNYIQCDEGIPTTVTLLTPPGTLPKGLSFSQSILGITGTAGERVVQAPYEFYLENPSGYVIVKIQISIQ